MLFMCSMMAASPTMLALSSLPNVKLGSLVDA
jgi:hypothetical protein